MFHWSGREVGIYISHGTEKEYGVLHTHSTNVLFWESQDIHHFFVLFLVALVIK